MQTRPYSYLFEISYFGARYKGWVPQPNQPSVQRQLERVISHVFSHKDFSLIGASRTDSGVSCRQGFFQLFLKNEIELKAFADSVNEFLPPDIRIKARGQVGRNFNLIQSVETKTYHYYFSDSDNFKPLNSANIAWFKGPIDLDKMVVAAEVFIGSHDFRAYCKPSPNKDDYARELFSFTIEETKSLNEMNYQESFFQVAVEGSGFLHQQIRKMVTALVRVGQGEWHLSDLHDRLTNPNGNWESIPPAPANGLILWEVKLKEN